ncbi:transcriptional regulator, TetR family [Actinacidiphila alni]|uniref:Transcriptional regulator, TetR family n=1 Tax=Actinacidiphila alni TaxID=380248 RepID=A0A1I1YJX7_9ACTN|nr:TetR family transcriptional regulator [Actinacidiphila alni]SFE18310.1 transcriptional regulator, TetR family [Actinacidiphila alni]
MGRWEPGAGGRLREAALALFVERGFEQTMVADIAARAGVTARTFFRHYADKREVLFDGAAELQERALAALAAVPPGTGALDAVAAALDVVAELLGDDREFARRRQAVIMADTELRERELAKFAALSAALADALRQRGTDALEADIAAETGVAVHRVAYERWLAAGDGADADLRDVIHTALARLRALTAA